MGRARRRIRGPSTPCGRATPTSASAGAARSRTLASLGVAVEEGPVERQGAGGRGRSVYFLDPDGSLLELISYGV
jgi:catechol 2,3-dioxygenase-like lactoylglutathione lyase family enzyme